MNTDNSNAAGSRPASWLDRLSDGGAALVRDIATDLHAAYVGTFFHGSSINQPYLTGRATGDQEHALSEIAGGLGDGLRAVLGTGEDIDNRLQDMRKDIGGHGHDGPDNEHDRGRSL